MPSRHSKNAGDKHHFTYHEKARAGFGSLKQRLGSESQLPFGYCALSMYPAEDPVVSPSGHIYDRESILEYLLTKSKEIKKQQKKYEDYQLKLKQEEDMKQQDLLLLQEQKFLQANNMTLGANSSSSGSSSNGSSKRRIDDDSDTTTTIANHNNNSSINQHNKRNKLIDVTDEATKLEQLKKAPPWVPQFTPQAAGPVHDDSSILTKRPASPFTGRPLRSKDLIPITLTREQQAASASSSSADSSIVRFICPISRKTITNQQVIFLKNTGTLMIEQAYTSLALPSKACPMTGKSLKVPEDVIEIVRAASGFAASGQVEVKVHKPTIN